MDATQPAARRLTVTALVTVAVAAWFVIATGAAFAETHQRGVAATPTQVTLTPAGTMKLTVVAQRTQEAGTRTAAVRGATNS